MNQRPSILALKKSRCGGADVHAAPRWGALIEEVDRFDPAFFSLSEDEARLCDPRERMVTQALYHALQHAGLLRTNCAVRARDFSSVMSTPNTSINRVAICTAYRAL